MESAAIFSAFSLSKYIQVIAKMEVRGREAINPPIIDVLLLISETTVIKIAEIIIFKRYLRINSYFPFLEKSLFLKNLRKVKSANFPIGLTKLPFLSELQ